jgi:methyl-accepting chemotaxis protein
MTQYIEERPGDRSHDSSDEPPQGPSDRSVPEPVGIPYLTEGEGPREPSRQGWLIVLTLGLAGLLLLLAPAALSETLFPTWPAVLYLALAILAVVFYLPVYRAQRRIQRDLEGALRRRRDVESVLVEALDQLRTGDLVACSEQAEHLPDRLSHSFTGASDALDNLAQQIQNSSIEVASSANSVNEIASELASGSSEQAASVVEITAAMEELARTASQIADNATVQADLAAKAEESGSAGAVAVEEAVDGVEEVRKRISGIASRADTLGTRSKEIYRVLDLITEISQETHILSLNAAIEAAAAGEHGRRFSVVAEEVRRLAQRSQESVDSVRNLLDEFASSIRATVVATEEGTKEAARVLERARAAASAIDELKGASSDTARVAKEISLATQQQNAASDEVVLTLKEVSQVVQRMADGLKQFSSTSDRLNHLALTIQLLAQSFHLDSPRSLKHRTLAWGDEIARRSDNWEAVESLLQRVVEDMSYVELAFVVGADGKQIGMAVNSELLGDGEVPANVKAGDGVTERPWFRGVTRERRSIITSLYDSLLSDDLCFTVAVPLWGAGGDLRGVFGVDINVGSWTKI